MVYLSTCMYLGIFAHSSFCQPGTLYQLSASVPYLKPTSGQKLYLDFNGIETSDFN